MKITCRFCDHEENGQSRIFEHEISRHRTEYFLTQADELEEKATKILDKAKQLRAKYQPEVSND